MRIRASILGLILAAVLMACGGGGDGKKPTAAETRLGTTPAAPVTRTGTLDCSKFADTAKRITDAEQKIYTGTGSVDAATEVAALKAELNTLKDGAPGEVKAALDDLAGAFDKVVEIMKNPTSSARSELAALTPKLSTDGQKIAAYVATKCQ